MKTLYNEDYFERGNELNISGYSNYRWIPELTIPLAFRIIELLQITREESILDYGCAKGYLVKALRLLYRDAYGYDISSYALQCAPNDVRKYLTSNKEDLKGNYTWIIAKDVLETDWNIVLKHVIFTIHDYYNIQYKNLIKDEYGRVKCIIWDDFALHSSVYRFMTSDNRFLAAFIEDFEAVREDVAVFIATYATPEMVSPKLRDQANIIIDCYRRGRAKIYCKQRILWFINRFVKTGELRFSKIPKDIYLKYEELKRRAKIAKEYEVYDDEFIKKILEKLDQDDRTALMKIKNGKAVDVDQRTLAKLLKIGLVDSHLELTPLGKEVLRYIPPTYHARISLMRIERLMFVIGMVIVGIIIILAIIKALAQTTIGHRHKYWVAKQRRTDRINASILEKTHIEKRKYWRKS